MDQPHRNSNNLIMSPFQGKRIFVTGGSGFVGTRLIETLILDHGANVTALVNRANAGALRMARFPVEFAFGDIRDPKAMLEATKGAEIIIHMAYGMSGTDEEQRRVTVGGTSALVEAGVAHGVSRFVNVGTAAVYFGAPDGVIDETAPRRKWGNWVYPDSKLDAEDLVMQASSKRGLPGTIVQVAGVYGPWGGTYTISPIRALQSGRVVLVNGGSGISNATYVDDTVQAILLAAFRPGAVGETFLIRGPDRVTRRELYAAYEKMLGFTSTIGMTLKEIKQARKKLASEAIRNAPRRMVQAMMGSEDFKGAVKSLPIPAAAKQWLKKLKSRSSASSDSAGGLPGAAEADKPFIFPAEFIAPFFASEVEYSTAKAERLLGYQPRYGLAAGMALTEKWARWAGVIGKP
jgi:nucleoside-diphosphate-sugar epimerase